MAARGIDAELSDAARAFIAAASFDPVYGARPLKRVLQHQVADSLAREMLEGRVTAGQRLLIDLEAGRLVFRPREGADAAGETPETVIELGTA